MSETLVSGKQVVSDYELLLSGKTFRLTKIRADTSHGVSALFTILGFAFKLHSFCFYLSFGFTTREPLEYLPFIVHLLSLIVSIVV